MQSNNSNCGASRRSQGNRTAKTSLENKGDIKETSLQALGKSLETLLPSMNEALEERRKIQNARANHRAHDITDLIDESNQLRVWLYGELNTREATLGLDRGWAKGFFLKLPTRPAKKTIQEAEAPL